MITHPLPFHAAFRQSWGTNKYVSQRGAFGFTVLTFYSNSIVAGTLSKVSP